MDHRELVVRLKNNDRSAFDELYEFYKNDLLRMAYVITHSLSDSEDIVQETFVKCFLNISQLRDDSQFKSWLYQILHRTAWQFMKKKDRETPSEDFPTTEAHIPSSLNNVIKDENRSEIWNAIQNLSPKHRSVIVLFYYSRFSTKEIAKTLGCLEGTVKSRLNTARKQLKKSLSEDMLALYQGEEPILISRQPGI